MKTFLATILLVCSLAPARAVDCAKNADACSASQKPLSPFLEAAAAEAASPPRPAAVKENAIPLRAEAPSEGAVLSAAAAVPAVPQTFSSPFWLVFIGGSVAGLYLYLGGGAKKGKKK